MDPCLQRLRDVLSDSFRGMRGEDMVWHPEGKWSAAEVLEHLYLTYAETIRGGERCLQAAAPQVSRRMPGQLLPFILVVKLGHMPNGRKTPERVRPKGTPAAQVVAEIGGKIDLMDEMLSRCEERHGKHAKLWSHPILGPLTGKQWRKFHWVHGQHHAKQILRLRAARAASVAQ